MRKTIVISDSLDKVLKETAKFEGINQSHLIETALTVYLMMYKGAPVQAKKLSEMIVPGQVDVFELLEKEFARQSKSTK